MQQRNAGDDDAEFAAKQVAKSVFYFIAVLTSDLLILATVFLLINLTSLMLLPIRYTDDFLYKLGSIEGLPSGLLTVSLVLLLCDFPIFMFIVLGSDWVFYSCTVITSLIVVLGLGYFAWMGQVQAGFLDRYLHKHVDEEGVPFSSRESVPTIEVEVDARPAPAGN